MKNLLTHRTVFVLLFIVSAMHAHAQQANGSLDAYNLQRSADGDTAGFERSSFAGIVLNEMSVKMVRNFASVKDARNARWFKIDGGFIVYFTQKDMHTRRYYDTVGDWLHDISCYKESHLPKEIKRRLKDSFFDCTIVSINEIITDYGSSYMALLQNSKCWKRVMVDQDQITIIEQIDK